MLKTILANKLILALVAGVTVAGVGAGLYFGVLNKNDDAKSQTETQKSVTLNTDSSLCSQIPSSVVADAIGKSIVKAEAISNSARTTNACQYSTDDTHFVSVHLNIQSYEDYKKGQQVLDRTITTNSRIDIEHFVAIQENGLINNIVFKISDNSILSIDRSSGTTFSEDDMINLAVKLAGIIGGSATNNSDTDTGTDSDTNAETNTGDSTSSRSDDGKLITDFFGLIDDGKASDAVNLMSNKNTSDDSTKQAWGVQFNAMTSVAINSIALYGESSWTDSQREYRVELDINMNSSSADEPIPYYGYENGQNTRFIILVNENGTWKIDGISTGP